MPQPVSGTEAKVVSDVAEVKRLAKGHRKAVAETGPDKCRTFIAGLPMSIVGQLILVKRYQIFMPKEPF